jgi:23S rRNA U2552 (ribose-2'-O)-methylase RlmE/FtsJ
MRADSIIASNGAEAEKYFEEIHDKWISSPLYSLFLQRRELLTPSLAFDSFLAARKLYWERHDEMYQIQYDPEERRKRRAKQTNTHKTAMFFLQTCYAMMNELLESCPLLSRRSLHRVLDLCAAPGGFCAALLERMPDVKIDSYTLHPDDGGAPMITKHKRLNSTYRDVIDLSSNHSFNVFIRYDLVILGGAWAAYVDEVAEDSEFDSDKVFYPNLKLKFAEVHIMLQCLRPNGIAIVKLPLKFENLTGTLIWILLEKIFKYVEPFRPSCESCSSLWSHSFVYMVCHEVRSKEVRDKYVTKLKYYLECCLEQKPDFIVDFLDDRELLSQVLVKEERIWGAMTKVYINKLRNLKTY